jgi:hypothetical protein
VRLLVRHGADERGLAIVPAQPADAGARSGRAVAPVAADEHLRRKLAPRGERHRRPGAGDVLPDDPLAVDQRDPRLARHRGAEGGVEVAILDHLAHRALFDLGVIETEREGKRPLPGMALADADAEDRLRMLLQVRPDADGRKHAHRGNRQRIGAPVEAGLGAVGRRAGIDHGDAKAALRQRQRQRRAVQPAAHDQDIGRVSHAPNMRPPPALSMRRPRAKPAGATAEGEMRANWQWMGAAELGRGIAAGDICPVALTETYLEAAESHPHRDRIFARLMRQQALDTAMAARTRAKAGLRRGPLDGVPVSWKDLFDTAGVATEAGTALLKGGCRRPTPRWWRG